MDQMGFEIEYLFISNMKTKRNKYVSFHVTLLQKKKNKKKKKEQFYFNMTGMRRIANITSIDQFVVLQTPNISMLNYRGDRLYLI